MDKFVKQVIEETFASKRQQRYFYHKAEKSPKWAKIAKEFSDKTNFSKLPERAEEEQMDATPPFTDKTLEVNADSSLYKKKGSIAKSNMKDKVFDKKSKKEEEEQITSRPVTGEDDYLKNAGQLNGGTATNPEVEVDEIVDADGNIAHGDEPGNPNAYIRSKKTSDEVSTATMGQMGSFGVLGGPTNANKTLKYWAESDMSKALGADETIKDPKTDYKDAVEHFEDDLEVPEDEAKERAKKMGYDPELPDGKMRLIENPLEYIKEYLAKKSKKTELVKKHNSESEKKPITPIIKRQLQSIKQTLKNNNLTVQDITEYLEDNE
jgi:hypothetical protein